MKRQQNDRSFALVLGTCAAAAITGCSDLVLEPEAQGKMRGMTFPNLVSTVHHWCNKEALNRDPSHYQFNCDAYLRVFLREAAKNPETADYTIVDGLLTSYRYYPDKAWLRVEAAFVFGASESVKIERSKQYIQAGGHYGGVLERQFPFNSNPGPAPAFNFGEEDSSTITALNEYPTKYYVSSLIRSNDVAEQSKYQTFWKEVGDPLRQWKAEPKNQFQNTAAWRQRYLEVINGAYLKCASIELGIWCDALRAEYNYWRASS